MYIKSKRNAPGIYKEDITMISAGDFRNGLTVLIEGNIYQILEFQHVKPGKGAAFVRTKLKNIISGGVVEKTFRPTENSIPLISTEKICSICILMVNSITSWMLNIRPDRS